MKAFLVFAGLGLVGLLGGCGIPPTDPLPFGEPAQGAEIGDQVYLILDGKIFPTLRDRSDTRTTEPVEIINALAAGPLPAEQAAGLTTEVPADLRFFGAKPAAEPAAELNLFMTADPTGLSDLAATQIACTAIGVYRRSGAGTERLILIDRAGHRRGPLSCPAEKQSADR